MQTKLNLFGQLALDGSMPSILYPTPSESDEQKEENKNE